MKTVDNIIKNNTGKVIDKWESYLTHYDKILLPIKADIKNIVEIGVQNGGSLEMWAQYFLGAQSITGIDINPKCSSLSFNSNLINVIIGDASKLKTLQLLPKEIDLVIDDGSHRSSDIISTFINLLPSLNTNALYIVEDICCSYWQEFEGGVNHPHSSMNFFKKVVDIINFEHWRNDKDLNWLFDNKYDFTDLQKARLKQIESIQFMNSMVFIKFSNNQSSIGQRVVKGGQDSIVSHAEDNSSIGSITPEQKTNKYSA
jgi:cephalosporin hydroxylase